MKFLVVIAAFLGTTAWATADLSQLHSTLLALQAVMPAGGGAGDAKAQLRARIGDELMHAVLRRGRRRITKDKPTYFEEDMRPHILVDGMYPFLEAYQNSDKEDASQAKQVLEFLKELNIDAKKMDDFANENIGKKAKELDQFLASLPGELLKTKDKGIETKLRKFRERAEKYQELRAELPAYTIADKDKGAIRDTMKKILDPTLIDNDYKAQVEVLHKAFEDILQGALIDNIKQVEELRIGSLFDIDL